MFPLSIGALAATPQPPQRLHHNIDGAHTFRLKNNVRPALSLAQDLGPLPDSQTLSSLSLHFSLTPAQQADLTRLQAQLQDPTSKQFHKFLTPEQYGARFGLNTADLEKIKQWVEENGFSDVEIARSPESHYVFRYRWPARVCLPYLSAPVCSSW